MAEGTQSNRDLAVLRVALGFPMLSNMTLGRRLPISLVIASAIAIATGVAGCSVAQPGAVPTPPLTTDRSGMPTAAPSAAAPEAVLEFDSGGAPSTYERTWADPDWPAVAVPPAPTPRLATTCPQFIEAAGLSSSLRTATVQPNLDTLAVRQGGATVCWFTVTAGSARGSATLNVVADATVGRSTPPTCSASEVAWFCRGLVDVGAGSASVVVELPAGAEPQSGLAIAEGLLDAAAAVLESPGTLRPVPAINRSAMGAGSGGCSPSTAQREAVFSQVDSAPEYRDVYGGSQIGNSEYWATVFNQRIGSTDCWWALGWVGMQISIIPGTGWSVGEAGVEGTPVTIDGANSAVRVERMVTSGVSYNGSAPAELLQMTVITSARGSTVITTAQVDPAQEQYWRERIVGVTEAIIATQP